MHRDWDSDRSGALDRNEFGEALKAMGFEGGDDAIDAAFWEIDADGNGKVDLKELQVRFDSTFATACPLCKCLRHGSLCGGCGAGGAAQVF